MSRYNQDQDPSHLPTDATNQSSLLGAYNPGSIAYAQDNTFYQPAHNFAGVDTRQRQPILPSSTTMTNPSVHHNHVPAYHVGHQLNSRGQFSANIPMHRRQSPLNARSSPQRSSRHQQILSAPTGSAVYAELPPQSPSQMASPNLPMDEHSNEGRLYHADQNGTQIGDTIIPALFCQSYKNFLIDDGEWTCYRRNYISGTCSYTLSNYTPGARVLYKDKKKPNIFEVYGFAMCVSGVVSEDPDQTMALVQYTAKRDKGPILPIDKVPMAPKASGQHAIGSYGDGQSASLTRGGHSDGYGVQGATGLPQEHLFQRLQYPSATLNNGNRRQTQQHYYLLVELWADIGGAQGSGQYIRVAYRRSRRIIVRGRSPGHYKGGGRKNSGGRGRRGGGGGRGGGGQHPGDGGAGGVGHMGGYNTMGGGGMGDFSQGGMLGGHHGGFHPHYSQMYGHGGDNNTRMGAEMSHRDAMDQNTKAYLPAYPGPVYEDQNGRLDMFNQTAEQTATMPPASLDMYSKQARLDSGVDILPRPSQYMTRGSLQNGGASFDGRCGTNSIYPSQGLLPGNCMLT